MSEDENMEIYDESMEDADNESGPSSPQNQEVYLPGAPLEEGEYLGCDESAYVMLHQAQSGAPCLSFDILKDTLGESRETFPMTAFIVAGTQAPQSHINQIIVMKLSNLHKTGKTSNDDDDDDEEESSDEEDEEEKIPKMAGAAVKHQGCVNRIRSTIYENKVFAASWSELGRVNIFDLTQQLQAVDNEQCLAKYNKDNLINTIKPVYTFSGHQQEGFAVDWCGTQKGVLATGDCKKNIHIWQPGEATWVVDQRPLVGHSQSVEDLQWSPNERCVLASCSVDRSVRIWDTRAPPAKSCMITCDNSHDSDVNVINWNHNEPFIISGGDDGVLKIWDLRRIQSKTPVALFKHHTSPITTVEWHHSDSAVFASGGSDNQIALWDLAVEKDNEADNEIEGLPPQLLFVHQGQTDIKELHWHSQLPGVIISTALDGFNIFKTISA